MEPTRSNEMLYLNLKLLGFEQYLNRPSTHSDTRSVAFNGSMFDSKNPRAFQCVTHFLIKTCGRAFCGDEILEHMRPCFPCLDRSQEVDFRKLVVKFFNEVEKDKDFVTKTKIAYVNIVQEAGGLKFIHLYLKLTNLILMRKWLDNEQRSIVREMTVSTPKSVVKNMISENLKGLNESKERMDQCKEKFFHADQAIIEPFEESKNSLSEWQDAVSNSCSTLMRSLGRADAKPLVANVKTEFSTQEEQLKSRMDKTAKCVNEITAISKSLMSVGRKLQEIEFGTDQFKDPVELLQKANRIQKSLEQQLLQIPGKVIEDNRNSCQRLSGQFERSISTLESLKAKLKSVATDERFEILRRQVLDIPQIREKFERLRKQLFPSRDPVLKFGAIQSSKLPRGWWMAENNAARNGGDLLTQRSSNGKTNGYISPPRRESSMFNVSADFSFHFEDVSMSHFRSNATVTSPREGITDESSFALVDLE